MLWHGGGSICFVSSCSKHPGARCVATAHAPQRKDAKQQSHAKGQALHRTMSTVIIWPGCGMGKSAWLRVPTRLCEYSCRRTSSMWRMRFGYTLRRASCAVGVHGGCAPLFSRSTGTCGALLLQGGTAGRAGVLGLRLGAATGADAPSAPAHLLVVWSCRASARWAPMLGRSGSGKAAAAGRASAARLSSARAARCTHAMQQGYAAMRTPKRLPAALCRAFSQRCKREGKVRV